MREEIDAIFLTTFRADIYSTYSVRTLCAVYVLYVQCVAHFTVIPPASLKSHRIRLFFCTQFIEHDLVYLEVGSVTTSLLLSTFLVSGIFTIEIVQRTLQKILYWKNANHLHLFLVFDDRDP